ncbi:MAG TPA: family 20 glycosylhydrolase [Bacteroidia bacterium]|nr:family 20 glycosylhydrolase [Bacteroidia bacterium]
MLKLILTLVTGLTFFSPLFAQQHFLMPVPQQVSWGEQRFQIDKGFHVVLDDTSASRAGKAVLRFLRRLDNRTQLLISKEFYRKPLTGKGPYLVIQYEQKGALKPGEDESYNLQITGDQAMLKAKTDIGVVHGLETFLQLLDSDSLGYFLKGVIINDKPRFVWRGLLIDVCRHFSPIDVIKRNIDAMAMVKMNVLHLHLSEDQGFRIESKVFPKLHLLGSNGDYYTQEQMKDLIQYASDRGIRVVPEFDLPGHATSWFIGYPELASAPGPFTIEKKFGVFGPTMNPTKKQTYKFLKKFLTEMCNLFPDEYFHIGGDENNGKQWDANKEIQEFMKKKDIKNNHELQNYFNTHLLAILQKNHKKMIGWDEILQPGLPNDALIQSWRGKEGLKDAAEKGHQVILSNGYYIDLIQPTWKHYMNDPLPADLKLTPDQQKMVLGGEATMWAELVTPENIDSRIWPRTAAIAERLWSTAETNNIPDMYRRLDKINIQLEEVGIENIRNQEMMLRRITQSYNVQPLLNLVAVVEPLKEYKRHSQGINYSTDLPFTRLPDIAFPDPAVAREFKLLCEQYVIKRDTSVAKMIEQHLLSWKNNHEELLKISKNIPALKEWEKLSATLFDVSVIGLESLEKTDNRNNITDNWVSQSNTKLKEAAAPVQEAELMVVESVRMLFQNALPK